MERVTVSEYVDRLRVELSFQLPGEFVVCLLCQTVRREQVIQ